MQHKLCNTHTYIKTNSLRKFSKCEKRSNDLKHFNCVTTQWFILFEKNTIIISFHLKVFFFIWLEIADIGNGQHILN